MAEPSAGPDIVTIETPEHVVIQYEVAGLMSRGLAVFIDHLIQLLALVAIFLVVLLALGGAAAAGAKELSAAGVGLWMLALFVVVWGYFVAFEIAWRGQTPGKRIVGIRVIGEGGTRLTPGLVLVRNLVRFLGDLAPFGYPAGALSVFLNAKGKRLGDFVAGTMVVRERQPSLRPTAPLRIRPGAVDDALVAELRRAGVHRLRADYVRLIDDFLGRRAQLDPTSRQRNAAAIAEPIAKALALPPADPERFLEHIKVALMQEEKA